MEIIVVGAIIFWIVKSLFSGSSKPDVTVSLYAGHESPPEENKEYVDDMDDLLIKKYIKPNNYSKNTQQKCIPQCSVKDLEEVIPTHESYEWWPTFRCSKCGTEYVCECFHESLDSFYKHNISPERFKNDPCAKYNMALIKNRYEKILYLNYKPNICHMCTHTPARYKLTHAGCSEFRNFYDPYIEKEAIRNGVLDCWEDIKKMNKIYREQENAVRVYFGHHKIGEKWFNETHLYNIIKYLFSKYEVIREASPNWLKPQRLDIFVPDLNLACEYQGEQHYKSIKHFGGEEALNKNKQRDEIKKEKCKENNVTIVYFTYRENITQDLVREKLSDYLKND